MRKSVTDFGAVGNGIADDYGAFQKALDSGAKEIYVPQGVYCISETLKIKSDTHIIAEKTAKIVMKSKIRRMRNQFLLSNSDTENGNKNIAITGGIWDGNNQAPENAKPDLFDKNGYSGALLNFVNVDGLTLCDMVIANSVTYYVRMSRLRNFEITDISLVSDKFGVNQDGLHFGGDVKHGVVKNLRALSRGQTNDDMIALNADDSIERVENLDLVRDSIEDITFENIYTDNCHTIIRMLSVTAKIKNIRFKNIYGGFRCNAINADGARYCRTPLFNDEEHPEGVGEISDIYIENFVCFPVFDLPGDFGGTRVTPSEALRMEVSVDNFKISGFRYETERSCECPALRVKNVTNQKIIVDTAEYILKEKDEELVVNSFENFEGEKNV